MQWICAGGVDFAAGLLRSGRVDRRGLRIRLGLLELLASHLERSRRDSLLLRRWRDSGRGLEVRWVVRRELLGPSLVWARWLALLRELALAGMCLRWWRWGESRRLVLLRRRNNRRRLVRGAHAGAAGAMVVTRRLVMLALRLLWELRLCRLRLGGDCLPWNWLLRPSLAGAITDGVVYCHACVGA